MIAFLASLMLLTPQQPAEDAQDSAAIARRELTAAQAQCADQAAAAAAELDAQRQRNAASVDAIVAQKLAIARAERELTALQAQRQEARDERRRAIDRWRGMHATAAALHAELVDLLAVLPPSDALQAPQRTVERFVAELQHGDGEPFDLQPLFATAAALLDAALGTGTLTTEVRDQNGQLAQATVLRAGLTFHACRTAAGDIGMAIGAPDGEAGSRWWWQLPTAARQVLEQAFADAAAGRTPTMLPFDPSGRIDLQRRTERDSAWALLLAGGFVMVPLALVALCAAAVSLQRWWFLRRQTRGTLHLAAGVLTACRDGQHERADALVAAGKTALARVLRSGLQRRDASKTAIEDAVQEQLLREQPALERSLPLLGMLAGIAPMLGLLGTVTGMMSTFDAMTALGTGDPGVMSAGIYEALITTVAGLGIAIPFLLVHNLLATRVDRVLAGLERDAAALINALAKEGTWTR